MERCIRHKIHDAVGRMEIPVSIRDPIYCLASATEGEFAWDANRLFVEDGLFLGVGECS